MAAEEVYRRFKCFSRDEDLLSQEDPKSQAVYTALVWWDSTLSGILVETLGLYTTAGGAAEVLIGVSRDLEKGSRNNILEFVNPGSLVNQAGWELIPSNIAQFKGYFSESNTEVNFAISRSLLSPPGQISVKRFDKNSLNSYNDEFQLIANTVINWNSSDRTEDNPFSWLPQEMIHNILDQLARDPQYVVYNPSRMFVVQHYTWSVSSSSSVNVVGVFVEEEKAFGVRSLYRGMSEQRGDLRVGKSLVGGKREFTLHCVGVNKRKLSVL